MAYMYGVVHRDVPPFDGTAIYLAYGALAIAGELLARFPLSFLDSVTFRQHSPHLTHRGTHVLAQSAQQDNLQWRLVQQSDIPVRCLYDVRTSCFNVLFADREHV
jgi:hypothetical protein